MTSVALRRCFLAACIALAALPSFAQTNSGFSFSFPVNTTVTLKLALTVNGTPYDLSSYLAAGGNTTFQMVWATGSGTVKIVNASSIAVAGGDPSNVASITIGPVADQAKYGATFVAGNNTWTGSVVTLPFGSAASSTTNGVVTAAVPPPAGTNAIGGIQLSGDLSGTAAAPQVVASHLASPLTQDQGGSGAATLGGGSVTTNATGSVARTLASKLSDVVSVCDFIGNTCPSGGDDTAAIANAYASTASGQPNAGKALFFPAGTYHFNLTIARSGVRILGAGRCRTADSTPVGTVFKPQDYTKPIITVGDGTSLVEKTTIEHFCMIGDGSFTVAGTSTSDGIKINGAYNTRVSDFEIGYIGGKSIYLTSSAARATSYNYFDGGTVINFSRYGTLIDYGSNFTTATYFNHVNWSPSNIGSGDYAVRLEGVTAWFENCWLQVGDGHAHLYLLKDGGGRAATAQMTNVFIDTGGNATYNAVDINIGGAHRLIGSYLQGSSWYVGGLIRWDDLTTVDGTGNNVATPSQRFITPKIQSKLYFDLATDQNGVEYNDANTPPVYLWAKERTTGGAQPMIEMVGGHFRIPGTYLQAFEFANGAIMWKNATSGGFRYRGDTALAGNDYDGVPISPAMTAPTYGASVAIDISTGANIFNITANNNTPFTIANPTNASGTGNKQQHIEICIINTAGVALGTISKGTNYKLVGDAFPSPAAGKRQCVGLREDADLTTWHETWRSAGDIAN